MNRLRAYLLAALAALGLGIVLAGPASAVRSVAAEADAATPGTVGGITLSALAVTMLSSLLLPVVTGLVTKYRAPALLKALAALAVSSIDGLIVGGMAVDGSAHIAKAAIVLAVLSFAIQTATYLGVYQPADANARLLPNVGLGRASNSR